MEPEGLISLIAEINSCTRKLMLSEITKQGVTGISPSHGDILLKLFLNGPLSLTELSALIRREKNTTTVLVRKLEEHGYVKRRACPGDRRKSLIELTEKGYGLEPMFDNISKKLLLLSYENFSEEEKKQLMTLLLRVKANFE